MLDGIDNTKTQLLEEAVGSSVSEESGDYGWRHNFTMMCSSITLGQTDARNLQRVKDLCGQNLEIGCQILAVNTKLSVVDCINVFLNRDFYFLLEKFVNMRALARGVEKFRISELLEVFCVWLLQMLEKQTVETLYNNTSG